MKKYMLIIIITVISIGVTANFIFAQPPMGCPGGMGGKGGMAGCRGGMGGQGGCPGLQLLNNPEAIKELGLSDDQQNKIKDIVLDVQKKQIQLKADIEILQLELKSAMDKKDPDKKEVLKTIDALGLKKTAMMKNGFETKLKVKEILTPEQVEKVKEKMKNVMGERMKMMGRGRMGMGPMGMGKGEGMAGCKMQGQPDAEGDIEDMEEECSEDDMEESPRPW